MLRHVLLISDFTLRLVNDVPQFTDSPITTVRTCYYDGIYIALQVNTRSSKVSCTVNVGLLPSTETVVSGLTPAPVDASVLKELLDR